MKTALVIFCASLFSIGTALAQMAEPEITHLMKVANEGEIDAAKLAKKRANNDQVKAFAKKMMDEHITIGRKFPEIKLNTSYSYGIDDNDFTLAFETDDLTKFQDLILQLRETKVSLYVVKDTPMIVCVQKDIQSIIMGLG